MKVRAQSLSLEALEDRSLLATCTVTNLLDVGRGGISFESGQVTGDLRFCINYSNNLPGPDTIDFGVSGTINLTRRLPVLATDIGIVEGPYAVTVRRDTGGNYRVLTVAAGATVRVTGLTLSNGSVDGDVGGGIRNAGDLMLINVNVNQSIASQANCGSMGRGGGIYNTGTAILKNSTLSGNKVTGCDTRGGGIYNAAGASLTLEETSVTGNRADSQGGGIYNASTLAFTGSNILSNTSYGDGGGIYNASGASFTMVDSSASGNVATRLGSNGNTYHSGGAFYNAANVTGMISESSITNNRAYVQSGGFASDGYVDGGGIYGGMLTILNSSITGNMATIEICCDSWAGATGGGISGGTFTIAYSNISGNTAIAGAHGAYAAGGGIYASATISNSTVSGNVASASGDAESPGAIGGGIYGSNLTITNSTISNNAQYGHPDLGYAGGIYANGATITHSTIAGNTNGGIYIPGSSVLTLRNSIVANNTNGDVRGVITNSGYNLIENPSAVSGYVPSDLLNVDPMLGALANNGGPTKTMALLPGSPAIDSGTNQMAPEFDQRGPGFPRIVNGTIDRGAFEVQVTGAPGIPGDLAVLITALFRDPND